MLPSTPPRVFSPPSSSSSLPFSTPTSHLSLTFTPPGNRHYGSPGSDLTFDRAVGSPPRRVPSSSSSSLSQKQAHLRAKHPTPAPSPWGWSPTTTDGFTEPDSPTRIAEHLSSLTLNESVGVRRPKQHEKLWTRYIQVEGVERDASEEGLRALFFGVQGIVGCFAGALSSRGLVVLVFNDVLQAVSCIPIIEKIPTHFLKAHCITRDSFRILNGAQANPLLSTTEGVIIISPSNTVAEFSPYSTLTMFGVLRNFSLLDSSYIAEYWDDRGALLAHNALHCQAIGEGSLSCGFEPTIASSGGPGSPMNLPQRHKKAKPTPTLRPSAPNFVPVSETSRPAFTSRPSKAIAIRAPTLTPSSSPSNSRRAPAIVPSKEPLRPIPEEASTKRKPFSTITNALHSRQPLASETSQDAEQQYSRFIPSNSRGSTIGIRRPLVEPPPPPSPWGIYRADAIPPGNVIYFDKLADGRELRTTIMLRNIPNRMTDKELIAYIEEVVGRAFDFLYLRIDFSSHCNVGYAFINFTSTRALLKFAEARLGTRWNRYNSKKLVVASFANSQGKEECIIKFKNSAVMLENESCQPKLFFTDGPNAGLPEPFPESDDPFRVARSAANVKNVGLFPSSEPQFYSCLARPGPDF
ncbi:meiosis protein Mei2 [Pseudohyphozyma bogoriensis]|nr:meiosis protein Mei2 [Pseudohyphozyma bogoriensis]